MPPVLRNIRINPNLKSFNLRKLRMSQHHLHKAGITVKI